MESSLAAEQVYFQETPQRKNFGSITHFTAVVLSKKKHVKNQLANTPSGGLQRASGTLSSESLRKHCVR